MGCGFIKKRVRVGTPKHKSLLNLLEQNLVSFKMKTNDGMKEVIGTLDGSMLPSYDSDQYRQNRSLLEDQDTKEHIRLWALNKNYEKTIAPKAGWCTIPLSSIDDYEVLNTGD